MKFQRHYKIVKGEINLIPFLNIVLLIAIYFIMVSNIVGHPVTNIKIYGTENIETGLIKVFLQVSASGKIFSEGKEIQIENLEAYLANFQGNSNVIVIIKGEENTPNGTIVKVMDIAHKAGIEKIAISDIEPGYK